MDKQLNLLYFSATDTTAKIVKEVADGIGQLGKDYDITLPANRQKEITFDSGDIVIIGVPVYAGRVPEFLIDYFTKVKGNQTKAVFIVVYGNRDYEDALLELKDIFEENGFIGIAGGAFIGEHSYTSKLATGRPDKDDLKYAREFGMKIKEVLNECNKVGVINVSLTGGDIFARNDWKELILSCVTLGYYPFLSTKTPLSFNDVRFLKNQHINEIQFSLDSLSDSILSSMINCSLSYLQKVKEMFVYCEKVGIKLIIRSVITTYNQSVDNFKKIFSFLVKFTNIQFWAITPAFLSEFKKYKNFYPSNSNLSNIVKFVDNIDSPFPIYLNKLNSEGYKLKIFDNVEDFVNHNQICHADVYMMSILSNGICTPCEMLYENPDFIMGNIKKNSLVEIWNSNKALNLLSVKG